jgi:hypothetical protein
MIIHLNTRWSTTYYKDMVCTSRLESWQRKRLVRPAAMLSVVAIAPVAPNNIKALPASPQPGNHPGPLESRETPRTCTLCTLTNDG